MEASGEKEDNDGGAVEFPIMHWEELSARIHELEQQQDRTPQRSGLRGVWEEDHEEEQRKSRLTSRFQKKLRVCFVNDGDSEDEGGAHCKVSTGTGCNGRHGSGLKQEVVEMLRSLRDKRLDELRQETKAQVCPQVSVQRMSLLRPQLELRSQQQLIVLRTSLQNDAHVLSAELVSELLIRDQLRTKQDALLLDLLDLT